MPDFLLVVRKATKTGNFKNTEMTTMPGDICLIYPIGIIPGTGEIWRNGRFGYLRIANQSIAFMKKFKEPSFGKILDPDGHPIPNRKRRYSFPSSIYETLSENPNNPTLTVGLTSIQDKGNA